MKTTETDILIQRYFDATATAGEEERLRAILADPATERTPAVEEARAVMGYTAVASAVIRPRRSSRRWVAAASVAASVAVVVLIGWHSLSAAEDNTAVIYANGRVIHSTEQAIDIMTAQLGAIGEAAKDSPATHALMILETMNEN